MSLVIYDPELGLLLDKLLSLRGKEPENFRFREINKLQRNLKDETDNKNAQSKIANGKKHVEYKNCKKCHICKLELNLNEIASLLCKILKNVSKGLVVYLVVSKEEYLYSTVTLNYVKSLYSTIVTNYRHHFNDLDIIVNTKFDLTILPIYDYNKLINEEVKIMKLGELEESLNTYQFDELKVEDKVYLHPDSKFVFEDFYELKSRNNLSQNGNTLNHNGRVNLSELDCMISNEEARDGEENLLWIKPYSNTMFCGTFDHLHFGHKLILLTAFLSCKKNLHIGVVASNEMLSNKSNFNKIQPLKVRKECVQSYLDWLLRVYDGNKKEVDSNELDGEEVDHKVYNYVSVDFRINPEMADLSYYTLKIHSPQNGPRDNEYFENNTLNVEDKSDLSTPDEGEGSRVLTSGRMTIQIFDLYDVIGPSIKLKERFGMLIGREIINNAIKVNDSRKDKNLVPWDFIIVGLVCYLSGDQLVKLSSTTIRELV